MVSPTGKGIRSDKAGDGHYGASRGNRRHNGVDYLCDEGQDVVAPFDMRIERKAYPSRDMVLSGIAWSRGKSSGRMFYLDPDMSLIGEWVTEGTVVGKAQSVAAYYNSSDMLDHIHFQVGS